MRFIKKPKKQPGESYAEVEIREEEAAKIARERKGPGGPPVEWPARRRRRRGKRIFNPTHRASAALDLER